MEILTVTRRTTIQPIPTGSVYFKRGYSQNHLNLTGSVGLVELRRLRYIITDIKIVVLS